MCAGGADFMAILLQANSSTFSDRSYESRMIMSRTF
jgi:hypothetical protein